MLNCKHNGNHYLQYLFETRQDVIVLPCGHTIHKNCLKEMREHHQWVSLLLHCVLPPPIFFAFIYTVCIIFDRYACPICSKSVCDMSKVWEKYDREIAATPMPEAYLNKKVSFSYVSLWSDGCLSVDKILTATLI